MNDEELIIFRRLNIGFVFQNYNLVPILNVCENIVLPVELDEGTVDRDFLNDVIHVLALEEKLKSMPNNLSGGQQQHVAIARALITKSAIILADELGLLKLTGEKFNQTIIIITHDHDIALHKNIMHEARYQSCRVVQTY